ncbi:MAG: methylaspartate ammonia-lyase [Candidatus Omnitrophica bacterium]|nr:methylaspartate ammonia-lyase [Candidatus Omnitrophota bacterium]
MMKIEKVIVAKGFGGFFWDDQAAIKTGIQRDGFIYLGRPVTPGFDSIRMPSECLSLLLILDDGQIAHGDCVAVQYSGASGRDPVFKSDDYLPFFREHIVPMINGRDITTFRRMADDFDALVFDNKPIHTAIRYGVTQAFLDAVAKSRKKTMAEVICEEYGLEMADTPIPVFIQTGDDLYESVDKCILRRVDVFPHYLINNLKKLNELPEQLEFTKKRITQLADHTYAPYLHYDLYGMAGQKYGRDLDKIMEDFRNWSRIVDPYSLIIEAPFIMDSREETVELTGELIRRKSEEQLPIIICVDEWCNTLEDVRFMTDAGGAEMIQVKTPDMGGLNQSIAAIQYCQAKGLKAYLGGTCCETERSAQISAHVALATRPFQMLAKPGLGIDEGYQIVMNEMLRTLAIVKERGCP